MGKVKEFEKLMAISVSTKKNTLSGKIINAQKYLSYVSCNITLAEKILHPGGADCFL